MTTLGAFAGAAGSGGHHGVDSRQVRPMTPWKWEGSLGSPDRWTAAGGVAGRAAGSLADGVTSASIACRSAGPSVRVRPEEGVAVSTQWDPHQYLRFADERARPFDDLMNRVPHPEPRLVVDLGCGPGTLTAKLSDRWPAARVIGVDSSAEMIASAGPLAREGRLEFQMGDLREWTSDQPVDVLVSNATLHWVPDHCSLFAGLVGSVAPGGFFAFQVPGNFEQPSHVLLKELAASHRWADMLGAAVAELPESRPPSEYLRALLAAGLEPEGADVWETTYLHLLAGPDAVLQWVKGTGMRPVLRALESSSRAEDMDDFLASYGAALRAAYPRDAEGRSVFPFRRIFAVARVPAKA